MDDDSIFYVRDNLSEDVREKYDEWCTKMHRFLLEVNMHWFFASKIEKFNKELFGFDRSGEFWKVTWAAHIEKCIIRIWTLVADSNPDAATLTNMLGFIDKHVQTIDPIAARKFRDDFGKRVNHKQFRSWAKQIAQRIDKLRNKFLAHLDQVYLQLKDDPDGKKPDWIPLTSKELETIVREVEAHWHQLNPGIYRHLMTWHYDDTRLLGNKTDVDELLDLTASVSSIVGLPERNRDVWEDLRRPKLTEEQLTEINRIRVKFGLPKVD